MEFKCLNLALSIVLWFLQNGLQVVKTSRIKLNAPLQAEYFLTMFVLWTPVTQSAKKPAMGLKGVVNGSTIGKNACGMLTTGDHWFLLMVIEVLLCVQVSEVKLLF